MIAGVKSIEKTEEIMNTTLAFEAWMWAIGLEKHTEWFMDNQLDTLHVVLGLDSDSMYMIVKRSVMQPLEIAHFMFNKAVMFHKLSNKPDDRMYMRRTPLWIQ